VGGKKGNGPGPRRPDSGKAIQAFAARLRQMADGCVVGPIWFSPAGGRHRRGKIWASGFQGALGHPGKTGKKRGTHFAGAIFHGPMSGGHLKLSWLPQNPQLHSEILPPGGARAPRKGNRKKTPSGHQFALLGGISLPGSHDTPGQTFSLEGRGPRGSRALLGGPPFLGRRGLFEAFRPSAGPLAETNLSPSIRLV